MRAAAALAFAVALRMSLAGRGGRRMRWREVDEAEDEEEVVDAGWAVMRAGLRRRLLLRPRRGGWRACPRVVGWGRAAGGPGRDLAARRADLVGCGGGGRRGAAAFSFWARLGPGPAMCEVVWVGVSGGNSSRGLHSGAGGGGPGSSGVCVGGVGGPLGGVGVPRGVGLPLAGVCGLSSVGGGEGWPGGWVCGGRVLVFGRGGGGPCRGARGRSR